MADMTSITAHSPLRKVPRRAWLILAAIVAAISIGFAYSSRYVECDWNSEFCAFGIAGTRSEVVVVWGDDATIYTQTYNGE